MIIQINTDKNLSVDDNENVALSKIISEGLKRYIGKITRIEVHLGDVDGKKESFNDKRCLLEARLEGFNPIAVTNHANSHKTAVKGAVDKLKTSLDTRLKKS
jgi:ribosome-associated translation inhibitor RaiA